MIHIEKKKRLTFEEVKRTEVGIDFALRRGDSLEQIIADLVAENRMLLEFICERDALDPLTVKLPSQNPNEKTNPTKIPPGRE